MDITNLSMEEKNKVVQSFADMRLNLDAYMKDREFKMSNPQVFTFLIYAPVCLAIASDRHVDENEIKILEKITKNIDVNTAVSLDLLEVISIASEPVEVLLNEEFNMRIDSELLYLARNIDKYETGIIEASKALLKIDKDPTAETSITATFSKWFDFVLDKNASKNKQVELEKVKSYKQKLGI